MNEKASSKIKILNIDVDNISSLKLLQKIKTGGILFTPNVDHLMKLQKDAEFHQVYQQADYVVCDSKIIYWASIFLGNRIVEKISGSDFFPKFYQHYKNDEHIKIFLLGGIDRSAEIAREKINQKVGHPIVVGAYSPSMGFDKNELECQKIVDLINNSEATVLAIGVGAPKQEKWIVRYKKLLPKIKIFLAIGATIDFEAEITQRSPKWMSQVGLEWLYRLMLEPKRLWKRYLIESTPFFLLIFKQKFHLYRHKNSSNNIDPAPSKSKKQTTISVEN
jgi:N-acetylglucosaminyldiphosphoundecaprenol N-acetyl-beta-D-mannosaminyltransferase